MLSPTSDEVILKTESVIINGQPYAVSILEFHVNLLVDPEAVAKLDTYYRTLADQFEAHPAAAYQKSVCTVTDATYVAPLLAPEIVRTWFETNKEQAYQTQHYLFSIFKRPAFQLIVLDNQDAIEASLPLLKTNAPNANPPLYVQTIDKAMEEAVQLLKIAHRL